jgi:hypothetical protein
LLPDRNDLVVGCRIFRAALQEAASSAGLMIMTEAGIAGLQSDSKPGQFDQARGAGMGGMM